MRILRKNTRTEDPEVSLVLLDWGCRESFHTPEYLSHLVTPRHAYEVLWVEYYDRQPTELTQLVDRYERHGRTSPIDTWIVMERPKGEVFRKHWMNNLGFLHSRGKIVVFMDSDAITSPTFVETFLREFEGDPSVVLYIEEIRTGDRSFYPFRYPAPKEIVPVASNLAAGVPLGMRNFRCGLLTDPTLIHWRNYGACFAARREDILRVGGWDEHDDYTGYIAGPYEMSMRMEWTGKRERWSFRELMWHVPHPGNDGIDNFSGPHDGRGVSTTAMQILETRRTLPLVENPEIRKLRIAAFGPETPPALEKRPEKPHVNEHTPTTPQRSNLVFVPADSGATWNNDVFFMLALAMQNLEMQLLGYEYPRATAAGACAAAIAKQLNLPQERVEAIYICGMLTSLEKLSAAGGRAEDASFVQHALAAHWNREPLLTAARVAAVRNERFDGSGPAGVRGNMMPREARIVAAAVRFDELVALRSADRAADFADAWRSIEAESGKRFDPQVVDAMRACLEDLICVELRAQHEALPFMYPCYRHRLGSGEDGVERATLGEFSLLTRDEGGRLRYTALPGWHGAEMTFSSYDRDEVIAFATPSMAVQDYHGHNILKYGARYFAVPHGQTEFKLAAYYEGKYRGGVLSSVDLGRLKRKVLRLRLRRKLTGLVTKPARFFGRKLLR